MKLKKIKTLAIAGILLISSCGIMNKAYAVSYQARSGQRLANTSNSKISAQTFAKNIRNMEAKGGTLGLRAKIEKTTLREILGENETANGVDVHMIKNTEWGVAQILTISGYGRLDTTTHSTTGNASGIYSLDEYQDFTLGVYNGALTGNGEYFMSGIVDANGKLKVDSRYANVYGSIISGDGMEFEAHRTLSSGSPVFVRGGSGLFNAAAHQGGGYADGTGSRAVLVVGAGL